GGDYGQYDGPCPPWNDSIVHHYHFTVYALDVETLGLQGKFGGPAALAAMEGHILAKGSVVGKYSLNPDVPAYSLHLRLICTASVSRGGGFRLAVRLARAVMARRMARTIKIVPESREIHFAAEGRCNSSRPAPPEKSPTAPLQSIPVRLKISPRIRICSAMEPALTETNCGRKAIKNSATFGLKMFVSMPRRKTVAIVAGFTCGRLRSPARSEKLRMPIQRR